MAYYLGAKVTNERGIIGLQFILVSSTVDPYNICLEIKKFAENFFGQLDENLKEEKFKNIKESVATKVGAPHNNLRAKFNFIVKEISENTRYFDRKEKEQIWGHLNSISLQDLKDVWSRIKERTFDVMVASKNHEESFNSQKVKTISEEDLKKDAEYWQDFFSKQ